MTMQVSNSDNDRNSGELLALDCNLTSLCDHIKMEGFNQGFFSDIVVHAFGSTYHLHRLILSRSSYFRNMLQGPWREANAPILTLHVDDRNVNREAIDIALSYIYGHLPKLNDDNAFRVLAAASFLDLQDLCAICTDFIISELCTSNFLAYQVFAESQDYGIYGERVRNACWGYLCQSGAMELKEVLPKLSSQTLHALLSSDELWVPSEEKRFELALHTLLAKGATHMEENSKHGSPCVNIGTTTHSNFREVKEKGLADECNFNVLESEIGHLSLKDEVVGHNAAQKILVELADCVVDSYSEVSSSRQLKETASLRSDLQPRHSCNIDRTLSSSFSYTDDNKSSSSYLEMPMSMGRSWLDPGTVAMEGPSEEISCCQLNNKMWLSADQSHCTMKNSSCSGLMSNEWERCGTSPLSWGGRVVGRREVKKFAEGHCGLGEEDYRTFLDIFEKGSLLYSNMSFEALLCVRKQLEELGFPCKAVNDGLWLQMLLSQRVEEIGADTCKDCCHVSMACTCKQQFRYSRGATATGYYSHEHNQSAAPSIMGNLYVTGSAQGEENGLYRPVRVHVSGPVDGLAGIGWGTTFVPAATAPPTRLVFSRVPFRNRNCQPSLGNDDPENRLDSNVDMSRDGLTALVGFNPGSSSTTNIQVEQTERGYETDLQAKSVGPSISGQVDSSIPTQMLGSTNHAIRTEWEKENSSISLDIQTPLSHFPPFRFGVEFQDVHRLSDGHVKHSQEVFYAGSLWKISVQAFNDEDPQGRRTLGLFLHRRKAEIADWTRKVHMHIDFREKVTARYQLICPAKREILVFGSFKQTGILLPKAPKGWGWRTALLFDELGDLLQNGALRVAATVQLV